MRQKSDNCPKRFCHLKRTHPPADEQVMLLLAPLRYAAERTDFRKNATHTLCFQIIVTTITLHYKKMLFYCYLIIKKNSLTC